MLDRPPPSTIASGSRMLITTASPRASRSAWRSSAAMRGLVAGGGAGRQIAGVVRAGSVAVAREGRDRRHRSPGSRACRTSTGCRGFRLRRGQGSGVWPHSPAMRCGPRWTLPCMTMPPPQPVPRMTPKTTPKPRAAPSVASLRAKQLASFSTRTSRSRACADVVVEAVAVQRDRVGVLDQAGGGADRRRECRCRRWR